LRQFGFLLHRFAIFLGLMMVQDQLLKAYVVVMVADTHPISQFI